MKKDKGEDKAKNYLNDKLADSKINDPTHKGLEWRGLLIRHPGPPQPLAAIYINRSPVDSSRQLMSHPGK